MSCKDTFVKDLAISLMIQSQGFALINNYKCVQDYFTVTLNNFKSLLHEKCSLSHQETVIHLIQKCDDIFLYILVQWQLKTKVTIKGNKNAYTTWDHRRTFFNSSNNIFILYFFRKPSSGGLIKLKTLHWCECDIKMFLKTTQKLRKTS